MPYIIEEGEDDNRSCKQLHHISFVFEEPWDDEEDPTLHDHLNKKGEFFMHDLHKITPKFLIELCIEMPKGSLIHQQEPLKYLEVLFQDNLEFKKHSGSMNAYHSKQNK